MMRLLTSLAWISAGVLLLALPPAGAQTAKPAAAPFPKTPPKLPFVELSVERTRHTRKSGKDYDDKSQDLQLVVALKNRNQTVGYTNLTAHLYVLAEDVVRRGDFKLVVKETQPVDLPKGQQTEFVSKLVRLDYDDHAYAKYGFKYAGWVCLIENAAGKVILGAASSDRFWELFPKYRDKALNEVFWF